MTGAPCASPGGALALGVVVHAADLRKKGADFWSCAENEVHWHRLRETVRYVASTSGRGFAPSAEHFTPLLPLWLSVKTGEMHGDSRVGSAHFTGRGPWLDFGMYIIDYYCTFIIPDESI